MSRPKGSRNKPKQVEQKNEPVANSLVTLTLLLNGKEYKAQGETTLEALRKLKPEFYKTRGTIVAEKDGRKVQRFLFIPQMRKLFGMNGEFANNNTQIFIAKFLQNMLN